MSCLVDTEAPHEVEGGQIVAMHESILFPLISTGVCSGGKNWLRMHSFHGGP